MKVFVTGATGFVGSAVIQELLGAGHQVVGLARSDANANSLEAAGAAVHRGELADLDSLRNGVAASDGVVHCGFIHDFSNFKASCEVDERAIEALGEALAGSDRPLLVTSGTALVAPGTLVTEDIPAPADNPAIPRKSEQAALSASAKGARVVVMRLPPSVHGDGDHGFIPITIGMARQHGVSAMSGDGGNHWPAVHRLDAAVAYRRALETAATAGEAFVRYHVTAEEGVPFRDIATVIGRRLGLPVVSKSPEEATAHFGWFAHFAAIDNRASSGKTRAALGWTPQHPGLLADIDRPSYFAT